MEYIRDEEMIHLIAKSLKGGLSDVYQPKYFKSDGKSVITHDDVILLYEISMTQYLADAEYMFDENTSLEAKLTPSVDSEIGYIVEVDLKYRD